MSKLIDSLKVSQKESVETHRSGHQETQEQLADVYFSGGDRKKKSDYPMVIKVVEKRAAASLVPWIITSVAFLITGLALFTTKRVFIDIHVVDENSGFMRPLSGAAPDSAARSSMAVPLDGVAFEGAARLKSSGDGKSLSLVNSSVANFARANIQFKTPLNLSASKLVFEARGAKGGENLALALKDTGNVLAFEKGIFFPFPYGLTADWQRAEIPLENLAKGFDARHVSAIRIEFGSKDAQNTPGDTLFIKDLRLVPA
jgi:hypothetical protein